MKYLRNLSLQGKIIFLNISMLCLVLLLVLGLVSSVITTQVKEDTGEQAMAIGRIVASSPYVKDAIQSADPPAILQPLTEKWRQGSDAAFIIVANMDEIRYSHPRPENIGKKLSDLYREPVLHGQEYLYIARGTLAPTIRANVPIFSDAPGQPQIGFVVVGYYLDTIYRDVFDKVVPVFFLFFAAILLSGFGSIYVARHIKKSILNLEPYEIAHMVKERQATLEAIHEGVIAVDRDGYITLLNSEAASLLETSPAEATGQHIDSILPKNSLATVINTQQPVLNEELQVHHIIILSNSIPITLNGEVAGAVLSFRERTEVQRLAEELTGVNRFVDVLRAQAHEFKNKMHAVAGMVQLKRYDEAINFLIDSGSEEQDFVDWLSTRIKDAAVCGLLIGKTSQMREMGIQFDIDPEIELHSLPPKTTSGDVILFIGNLLQNAIEATTRADEKIIEINLRQTESFLEIIVRNSGIGIGDDVANSMYQRGFSTKAGNTGLGLAMISEKLQLVSGTINHRNLLDGGVEFCIRIPYK